jgi:hypothetical protein
MDAIYRLWEAHVWLFDTALYFFIFAAASRAALTSQFPGRSGKVLAVALGAVLAVSLVLAQDRLGVSLASIGPVALFLLCAVIFVAAFALFRRAHLPLPLTVVFAVLLVFIMLRVLAPDFTLHLFEDHAVLGFLAAASIGFLGIYFVGIGADERDRRRPGRLLTQHRVLPSDSDLRRERRVVKRRLWRPTKQNRHDEAIAASNASQAVEALQGGVEPGDATVRAKIQELLNKAGAVQARAQHLAQLDAALERFDRAWLKRAYNVDLDHFPPALQEVLHRSIKDERGRLKTEEQLSRLETAVAAHAQTLVRHVRSAEQCLWDRDAAGATAWLIEAEQEAVLLRRLDVEALAWEKRLLRLVRDQQRTQARAVQPSATSA